MPGVNPSSRSPAWFGGSTRRVSRFANARFLLGTAIQSVEVKPDGTLLLQTNRGPLELDFLFFSTGFKIDWSLRSEFRDIAPHVLNWSDRYTPPAGEEDQAAGAVSFRYRNGEQKNGIPIADAIAEIKKVVAERTQV